MDNNDGRYSDAVLQAVDAGRKIEAIKLLREETGLGLKEAKDEVDRLAQERKPSGAQDVAPLQDQGGADAIIKIIVVALILFAIYRYLGGS